MHQKQPKQNLLFKSNTYIFYFLMDLIYKIMKSSVRKYSGRSHFTVLGTLPHFLKGSNNLPEFSILLDRRPPYN